MRNAILKALSTASISFALALALPQPESPKLESRQSIDFDLADFTPDPTVLPEDTSNFNPSAAIASVVAAISAGPQSKRSFQARDIIVSTYAGYTTNTPVGNAAMNAPKDCNNHVSDVTKYID